MASTAGTYSTSPGTLTIGFIAVRGLDADQDMLVQQVLGVRDDGLQLQRERHGLACTGRGQARGSQPREGGMYGERDTDVLLKLESLLFLSKRAGRYCMSTLPSMMGLTSFLSPQPHHTAPRALGRQPDPKRAFTHTTSLPFPHPHTPRSRRGGRGQADTRMSERTPLPTRVQPSPWPPVLGQRLH